MARNILLLDNSASRKQLVFFSINYAGYGVITTSSGGEALNKLDSSKVVMVIMGIDMPSTDGIELIKQMRRKPGFKILPIIMMTSDAEDHRIKEGITAGATGYIMHPFTSEQIIGTIKKFVN